MSHQAKAASVGSTEAGGSARGLLRRALITRAATSHSDGSGAPSTNRLHATLAVLALAISAFGISAATASAAPPTVTKPIISEVSYTSVRVEGKVTTDGSGFLTQTTYAFDYSTDGTNWTIGVESGFGSNIHGEAEHKPVGTVITGLKSGTKYFFRLRAFNIPKFGDPAEAGGTSPAPNPFATTLTADPPTIPGAVEASPIFSTTATATAKVVRPTNSDDVNCHFEYITDAQFVENEGKSQPGFEGATSVPCAQNPIGIADAGTEKGVTAGLTGLQPETEYHLRLVAENAASSSPVVKTADPITTGPKVAAPKILSINDAKGISYRTAEVSGEVERPATPDPAANTQCRYEFVTDEQFKATGFENAIGGFPACDQTPYDPGNPYGEFDPIMTPGPLTVTRTIDYFKSGATYHYRLTVENAGGTVTKEATNTFTTIPGGDPTLTLDPNPTAEYTTAHVSGTVTRGLGYPDERLSAGFYIAEAGTENFNEGNFYNMEVPPGTGPQDVFYDFKNLNPNTEYEFRIRVEGYPNGDPNAQSGKPYPRVKTRPLASPTATINPISEITGNGAKFSGSVDTHAPAGPLDDFGKAAYATKWEFVCSPECPGAGGQRLSGVVQGEEGNQPITIETDRLVPNTYYEVTLVARNEVYSTELPVITFQTPLILPTVKSEAGASDGEGGYVLQGIVNSNNSKITSCVFEYGTIATYPNTYQAPCLPSPSGPNEVQKIGIEATEGQFKLSFRGQTTGDLTFNATASEVQAALRALPSVGSAGVNVTGSPEAYVVTFVGKLAGANIEPIRAFNGTTPLGGGGGASVSTSTEGGYDHAISVEVHVENLTIGSHYHFRISATNAAGTANTPDREFIPTLAEKGPPCANEVIRSENSSFALPECRAYEMVSPPGKEGFDASLKTFNGGDGVAYKSGSTNIANSGQGSGGFNEYVALRTATGWETIPDLNGSSGSLRDAPSNVDSTMFRTAVQAYSTNLLSSVWTLHRRGEPGNFETPYLYRRTPDGIFTLIGSMREGETNTSHLMVSADGSHVVGWTYSDLGQSEWGPGIYELVGTDMTQPRRVDLDNSGTPISTCTAADSNGVTNAVSNDGSRIVNYVYGGCGGTNPPVGGLWARVNGTTNVAVSGSHCDRTAGDPGGACNGPTEVGGCTEFLNSGTGQVEGTGCRAPRFVAATPDGARVFFTTTQQLVNGDTDQANDIYYCDIPSGDPAPAAGKANPCAGFGQVSIAESGAAEVENVFTTSANGSTVLFAAKGVLAANESPFKEEAVAGDNNLYVWHQDSAHPGGQTSFVGRLDKYQDEYGNLQLKAQATPDGRYAVLTTPDQFVEADADQSRDVYRVDAETGEPIRVSTNLVGTGGNGPLDAEFGGATEHHPTTSISDDGQKIVFTTAEALAPSDGNGEPDVYLWTPSRVYLISTGSSGFAPRETAIGGYRTPSVAIDGSGDDIYFESTQALTPADGDTSVDVYDARVGGGFSFAPKPTCTGEACQPESTPSPPRKAPLSSQPGPGNPPLPKPCAKGKVRNKKGKCVKKAKKHHGKKGKQNGKKAGHKQGGGK